MKKVGASRLFCALKQWKSNDIPSIDYYAIIIVVYYKNRKFINNFIVNAYRSASSFFLFLNLSTTMLTSAFKIAGQKLAKHL